MFDDILGEEKKSKEYINLDYIPITFVVTETEVIPKERKLKDDWTIETKPDRPYVKLDADGSCNIGTISPITKLDVSSTEEIIELMREAREEITRLCRINDKLIKQKSEPALTIKKAREFMHDEFIKDPDWLRSYEDNIAMLLYDEQNWQGVGFLDFRDKLTRDRVAAIIMGLIFGDGPKPLVKNAKDNKGS